MTGETTARYLLDTLSEGDWLSVNEDTPFHRYWRVMSGRIHTKFGVKQRMEVCNPYTGERVEVFSQCNWNDRATVRIVESEVEQAMLALRFL